MSYNADKVKKKKKEENTRPTLVQFVIVPFSFCSIIWFIYTCNLSRDGYTGIAYRLLMRINKEDFLTNSLQRMEILDGIENENSSLNFLEISRIWRIFQQNFTSRNWLDRIESRAEFRLYTFNAEFTILERNDIPRNRQIPYHVVRSLVSYTRHCVSVIRKFRSWFEICDVEQIIGGRKSIEESNARTIDETIWKQWE